jgi:coproporphyrinogen III oxidase
MKSITSIIFILSFSLLSFSQQNRDKIKTLKIAFITEKLDLSEKEAQQFWPVYNAFEDEQYQIRRNSYRGKNKIDFDTLNEADASALLKEMRALEAKKHALKTKFIDDLTKILPAKKIIMLEKVEDDFKRKMFEEYRKRRSDNKGPK